MKKTRWLLAALAVVGGVALYGTRARAADHTDGTAATADPAADITDLYAWVDQSDSSKIDLIMNVFPIADTASTFSNAVQYVFHVNSRSSLLAPATAETDIICTFDTSTPQIASCWLGTSDYVTGDASATTGLTSVNSHFKVFAGLRDDPFFFNLDGFKSVVGTVTSAIPTLVGASAIDPAGCPQLDRATASSLVTALATNPADGGVGLDHFAGLNVLSIALQVDKASLLSGSDTQLSVWGSTNTSP